ncbi:CPBP family intramembrane glutamic endopeptidase [Bacillus massilinigeriensis]|uniref:CPBP family intramembrane glutamic endopeptidase n=1 Tax=Bacillus massilionigeriensis TaxID=1805475 RepID=UPI00096B0313|nr:CPBP family intramembrane glutamic endopeptidase [Bacillus massilionigeriensis]
MNKKLLGIIGKTILSVVLLLGLIIILNGFTQSVLNEKESGELLTPISLGLTAFTMYLLFERKKGWVVGWRDRHTISNIFMGLMIISIVVAISMSIMILGGKVTLEDHSFKMELVISQALLFLIVGLGEEWLFRGYFYGLYKEAYGVKTAIITNSLLFAAIHLLNPYSFSKPLEFLFIEIVNIFLLSLIMSQSRVFSGSLWMPIGIHFLMNFLQSSIFGFRNGGKDVESLFSVIYSDKNIWNGAGYGLESSLIFTPVLLIVVLLLGFLYRGSLKAQP